jgi:hypothetical protein
MEEGGWDQPDLKQARETRSAATQESSSCYMAAESDCHCCIP